MSGIIKPHDHQILTELLQNPGVKSDIVRQIQYFGFKEFLERDITASRVKPCTSATSNISQNYA